MSANIYQVYVANPITSNLSTDLMYFGRSPYNPSDDTAMTFANFSAQFSGVNPWINVTDDILLTNLNVNSGYTINSTSTRTFALPVTASVGDFIEINGVSAGGWILNYTTGQSIIISPAQSTVTTGSIASSDRYDCVKLRCAVENTTWTVISQQSNGLTIT